MACSKKLEVVFIVFFILLIVTVITATILGFKKLQELDYTTTPITNEVPNTRYFHCWFEDGWLMVSSKDFINYKKGTYTFKQGKTDNCH